MRPRKEKKKLELTFYNYFRPIALLCHLAGAFPLSNVYKSDVTKISYKLISLSHLYSSVFFYVNLFMIYYFSGLVFSDANMDISFIWRCVVTYIMLGRSVLCFLFCVFHSNTNTVKMLHILYAYDKKKNTLLDIKQKSVCKKILKWTIFPLSFGLSSLIFFYSELQAFVMQILPPDIRNETEGEIASRFFGILGLWQFIPLQLYIYFAHVIASNFLEVYEAFKRNINITDETEMKLIYTNDLSKILENIHYVYTLMSSAVQELSIGYGFFLALDQVCIVVMLVVNIYVFIFTDTNDIHLLICTFLNAILVLCVIDASHRVKRTAAKIVDVLRQIKILNVDKDSQIEIQTLFLQISIQPVEVSAGGYFTMDRNQIASILSSVATYLIVLIQFSPEIINQLNDTEITTEPYVMLN